MSVAAATSRLPGSFDRIVRARRLGGLRATPSVARRIRRSCLTLLAVYAVLWLTVNGGILLLSRFAAMQTHVAAQTGTLSTVGHLEPVDHHLWRSAAPSETQYRALRELGISTVVDLRQLDPGQVRTEADQLARFGLRSVVIPVPDGGIPAPGQIREFLDIVAHTRGQVLVHCGAGVGRTGTMVAAYLVVTGQANGRQAMMRSLSVGPPSIEQLAFEYDLRRGRAYAPPRLAVRVVSRIFDQPRLSFNSISRW
jgi:protein-tyrosine phosphatase